MGEPEIKVALTLSRSRGEKLRRMCHARGKTASEIVTEWLDERYENGEPVKKTDLRDSLPDPDPFGGLFDGVLRRRR